MTGPAMPAAAPGVSPVGPFPTLHTLRIARIRAWGRSPPRCSRPARRRPHRLGLSGYDITRLFSLCNQQPVEEGVGHFLEQVEGWDDPDYGDVLAPHPRLDFDGPFGLYAWELFLHLTLTIAAACRRAGKFDEARRWLQTVYDPQGGPDKVWVVWPLVPGIEGDARAIADPDRIAAEAEGKRAALLNRFPVSLRIRHSQEQGVSASD